MNLEIILKTLMRYVDFVIDLTSKSTIRLFQIRQKKSSLMTSRTTDASSNMCGIDHYQLPSPS